MTLSGALPFLVAAGSVTGRSHRVAERDGQDGFAQVARPGVCAVVVTDGCSSGRASEIGARIGAAWLAASIERRFACGSSGPSDPRAVASEVTSELVERLGLLARSMHPEGDLDAARIAESLLFGFLAAVVTPEHAIVFGIGDGAVLAGRETHRIDPGPANAPPYAAYALLGKEMAPRIHFLGPARDVSTIAIATDGIEPASCLADLAATPRLAANPSLLRKRLLVLANEHRFADDATVGVVRRIEGGPS